MKASWWERLTEGETGPFLMDRDMLNKSLIQFSIVGPGCVPSLLFDLTPNYGGGNEENGDLLQKVPCTHCCPQCPWPCSRPPPTYASAGDSWALTGKSGSVSCGLADPLSWSWFAQGFVCALQESVPPSLCKFWSLYGGVNADLLQEAYGNPGLLHPEPPPLWQATAGPQHCRRHSKHLKAGLTQSLMCTRFCLSPLSISGEYGVSF